MGKFILQELNSSNLNEAIAFIEPCEENSVALMGRLVDGSWEKGIYSYYLIYEKNGLASKDLVCVIMHSKGGLIQHCIKNPEVFADDSDFLECVRPIFENKSLYCVMGETRGCRLFEKLITTILPQKKVREDREYLLLLYNPQNLPDELLDKKFDFDIVRCGIEDKDQLFPLQKNYDIVEVLPKGKAFSAELCRKNLELMLKTEMIYAIQEDGKFVAKAGSNAIGKNYIQLGGVFTDADYRGRGMAQCLVSHLAKEVEKSGKKSVLFVRVKNESAKAAYRKAGFTYENDYLITYYTEDFE
ncbi:MAG: GNAT family N-acetyltransferase [Treponemataceae bacterium]|nr:GNAT family N-acetyltransferase [Treponemataceae bacterium]